MALVSLSPPVATGKLRGIAASLSTSTSRQRQFGSPSWRPVHTISRKSPMGRSKPSRCVHVRNPKGMPRTTSLLRSLWRAKAPSEGRGRRHWTAPPPEVCCLVPSRLRQTALGSFRMNRSPDTRRWMSGLGICMGAVRRPSKISSSEGTSPRTSPTRQSNSPVPSKLKVGGLLVGHVACLCPDWRQRRHLTGSRQSRMPCPLLRHRKQRDSFLGSTGLVAPTVVGPCPDALSSCCWRWRGCP